MKTLAELRDFYESIPDNKWCVRTFINDLGQSCANGLLGITTFYGNKHKYPEGLPLTDYRGEYAGELARINNGREDRYQQKTHKARVLAYLDDLITAKLKADGKLTTI